MFSSDTLVSNGRCRCNERTRRCMADIRMARTADPDSAIKPDPLVQEVDMLLNSNTLGDQRIFDSVRICVTQRHTTHDDLFRLNR